MGKATKRMTALENKLKRSGGKNKLVKENVASNDRQIDRQNDFDDFRNRTCFAFSLDNNSDILMLIGIIFD